jgi:DNA-binding NarL/FixJ family response regulator
MTVEIQDEQAEGATSDDVASEHERVAVAFAAVSTRELEVVGLVAEGLDNAAIARTLGISPRTVQAHVTAALRKTDCYSRTQLAVRALRSGAVPLH